MIIGMEQTARGFLRDDGYICNSLTLTLPLPFSKELAPMFGLYNDRIRIAVDILSFITVCFDTYLCLSQLHQLLCESREMRRSLFFLIKNPIFLADYSQRILTILACPVITSVECYLT